MFSTITAVVDNTPRIQPTTKLWGAYNIIKELVGVRVIRSIGFFILHNMFSSPRLNYYTRGLRRNSI